MSDHIAEIPHSLPRYFHYIKPMIEAQKELGGSSKAAVVKNLTIDKLFVSGRFLNEALNSRPSTIQADLQKVRQILVNAGFMKSAQKGLWELTDKGFTTDLSGKDLLNLDKVQKRLGKDNRRKRKRKTKSEILLKDDKKSNDKSIKTYKDDPLIALNQLTNLSAEESVSICERILLKSGFQKVSISAIPREKYIEGDCIFEENPFLWIKALFRLTCHKESIDAKVVRGFRTAMRGRADKGILMTINTFTMDAKWEAEREGTLPIIIIDRSKLINMISAL